MTKKKPVGWRNDRPQHALASKGIKTKAKGRVSDVFGEQVTEEDVRFMVKDLLPKEGKWYNHGDVDFDVYGGWAIKRDGNYIEVRQVRVLTDYASQDIIEVMLRRHSDIEKEAREELDLPDASIDELADAVVYNEFYIYEVSYADFRISNLIERMNEETGVWSFSDVGRTADLKWMIRDFVTGYLSYYGDPSARPDITTDIDYILEDFE